jgi:hypothetical protein
MVITAGEVRQEAELNDSQSAGKIWEALPINARASTWGDEVYFSIPVKTKLARPREFVEKGDPGYWDAGRAFCIFFGPTPASAEGEIRPASAVDVVGKLLGRPEEFKAVRDGDPVRVERLEPEAAG